MSKTGQVFELNAPEQLFSRTLVMPPPANVGEYQYTCEPTQLFPSIFGPGREVTGTFPRANVTMLGTGALRAGVLELRRQSARFVLADASGSTTFETARGTCQVVETVEGVERCLDNSPTAYESAYFSDEGCRVRLETWIEPALELGALRLLRHDDQGGVSGVYTAKRYEGPVYRSNLTVCSPVAVFRDELLVVTGERVELTTFPQVHRVHLTGAP